MLDRSISNHTHLADNKACNNHLATDDLMQQVLELQQEIDRECGISEYIDETTGKVISFEAYWAKKRFESQPFFILGKTIRIAIDAVSENVLSVMNKTREMYQWMTTSTTTSTVEEKENEQKMICEPESSANEEEEEEEEEKEIEKDEALLQGKKAFRENLHIEYENLLKQIDEAIVVARENNKPLLVLIGEDHYSQNALLVESIVLNIFAKKGISKNLLTESFFKESYLQWNMNGAGLQNDIEDLAVQLGFKKSPMDYAVCEYVSKHTLEWNAFVYNLPESESALEQGKIYLGKDPQGRLHYKMLDSNGEKVEDSLNIGISTVDENKIRSLDLKDTIMKEILKKGHTIPKNYMFKECETAVNKYKQTESPPVWSIAERDAVMAEVASELSEDAVGIVGATHVYGLMLNTPLSDHYHIHPLLTQEGYRCETVPHDEGVKLYNKIHKSFALSYNAYTHKKMNGNNQKVISEVNKYSRSRP